MGRYTGPSCRLCRRAGEKLFLKGDRCFSPRCAIERRPPARRRWQPAPESPDYGVHLREKQKARRLRRHGKPIPEIHERCFQHAWSPKQPESASSSGQLYTTLGAIHGSKLPEVQHGHFAVNGRKPTYRFLASLGRHLMDGNSKNLIFSTGRTDCHDARCQPG